MNIKNTVVGLLIFFMLSGSGFSYAQSTRALNNDGVEFYENNKFPDAEVNFKKGTENDFETFEVHFNLGDALYKQGRYEEAIDAYRNAMTLTEDPIRRSKIYYNMGNALLKSQKLDESIEAYKNSLKIDPNDLEAKYNLSYALKLKNDQDKQQNQQQQNNQDKNQDQNKDQKQNQDQQQNQDQKKNEDQDQKKQDEQEQQQPQPQPKNQMSKEEAKRILDALKNNEAELQKELRKRKAKIVKKEKDW